MDAKPQAEPTVGEYLLWLGMTLDYTDKIAAAIPDELLDWRPEDPSGKYCFSLAEIVMHIADARLMFACQLTGDDASGQYWATSEGPNEEGIWAFGEYDGKQALLSRLESTRETYSPWIGQPYTTLLDVPDGARKAYDGFVKKLKEEGHDTAAMEKRGPASVLRVLMAVVAHEAGHRGALQTLLRQHGINVDYGEE
jgi:uncharacterized damage-inducible protein DinB